MPNNPAGARPSSPAEPPGPPLLSIRNAGKRFGATVALHDVSLDVHAGTVHILAGENGAGKSTLMKALMGVHLPDTGEITWRGAPLTRRGPVDVLRQGIAMIYQELNLALHLPVHSNVFLGQELTSSGFVRERDQIRRCNELFDRLSADLDPKMPTAHLGIAQRQLVEIARALAVNASLIIMDEPTAALSEQEAETLFETIRSLKESGVAIIYISHYLEEFGEIGDEVSVLRDGELVHHAPIADVTIAEIIQHMVGRKIEDLYPHRKPNPRHPMLTVQGLNSPNGTRDANFEVRAGEIVGVAGLVGSGRTEMFRAAFGLDRSDVSEFTVKTNVSGRMQDVPLQRLSPTRLVPKGVGLLSEDRSGEGLAQNLSIGVNATLSSLRRCTRGGLLRGWWVSDGKQNAIADTHMQTLSIKATSATQRVGELSGGNQQKVAIARLLSAEAQVFLMDEPTRGIDIGAKQEIYRLLCRLAEEGRAVIFISSYLPEIFGLCDSLYVMCRGSLSRKYAVNEIDEHGVMALATGLDWEPNHG